MKRLLILLAFGLVAMQGKAQNQYLKNGVAVQGYDVVAYFEDHEAIEGQKEIQTEYHKAIYRFSNDKNKALFSKNPEKFAPQYGGYCAYGVSENHT